MTVHKDQVSSVISRAVQSVLSRGLNDPRVRGLMTVTRVVVSSDIENVTVMVSVIPSEHAELTLHGLRHAAQHIRTEVGKLVRIRRMPKLAFKLDESLKKEAQVLAAIERARVGDQSVEDPAETSLPEESES